VHELRSRRISVLKWFILCAFSKQTGVCSFSCNFCHKTRYLKLSCLKFFGTSLHLYTYKLIPSSHLSEKPFHKILTTSFKPKYVYQYIDITETKRHQREFHIFFQEWLYTVNPLLIITDLKSCFKNSCDRLKTGNICSFFRLHCTIYFGCGAATKRGLLPPHSSGF
jgi:hypothetical protein